VLGQFVIERLSDLLRLTNPAALNEHVVELLQLRQRDQLLDQVAAEGAADAAVLQRDDLLLGAFKPVSLLDQGGVDVDAARSGE
jgi:hypothetical protein